MNVNIESRVSLYRKVPCNRCPLGLGCVGIDSVVPPKTSPLGGCLPMQVKQATFSQPKRFFTVASLDEALDIGVHSPGELGRPCQGLRCCAAGPRPHA